MVPKQCLKWSLCAIALTLFDAGVAQAEVWTSASDCGCNSQSSPMSWTQPLASSPVGQSHWITPAPPYNSSWARVPVTNYRPQVVIDPTTGVNVTTIQPCNTCEWQPRRTPGCSLWQSLVNWFRCNCFCTRRPSMCSSATNCPPGSEWVVSTSEPTGTPYYAPSTSVPSTSAPSTNGRLVPVPSGASPATIVPADRRPQLDPLPSQSGGQNSASRMTPQKAEIFVRTLDDSESFLELTPPLVAPRHQASEPDASDGMQHVPELLDVDINAKTALGHESTLDLVPVSWASPAPSAVRKLPTDEVWDDTGWRSEQ